MIRGIYRKGVIHPTDPVPLEWAEGQEVRVESAEEEVSDNISDIDRWDAEWQEIGGIHYEPGEKERIQAILEEADTIAKEFVRRRMESGR